jgi:CRISPR-associated endonuclease/helicase Cas3
MNQPTDYFRYWGKAEKDGPGYHLLVYHCLDVAAVVAEWWASSPAIRRSFCSLSELSEEQIRAWVLFFTALHDYGKFDVRFQLRVKTIWQKLYAVTGSYGNLPSEFNCKQYYHGESGLFWLMQDHGNVFGLDSQDSDGGLSFLDDPDESVSENRQVWKTWFEAVTGHHGQIKHADYIMQNPLPPTCDPAFADIDRQARGNWVGALARLFLEPLGLSLADVPPPCSPLMAGFCSVADWMGSR